LFIGSTFTSSFAENNKDPKISIIIPVFNSEKFLNQCLYSLIKQTFNDIEIICVNDGSTDTSQKILEEWHLNDYRIQIIDQSNKGPSAARNAGILQARGEYIWFVDSDDWVELNACESLYKTAKERDADIVSFRAEGTQHGYKKSEEGEIDTITYSPDGAEAALLPNSTGYVWDKLFKRSLISENQIFFPEEIRYCEDNAFRLTCYFCSKCSVDTTEILYHYRTTGNSLSSWPSVSKHLDRVINGEIVTHRMLSKTPQYQKHIDKLYYGSICWLYSTLFNPLTLKNENIDILLESAKKMKQFLNSSFSDGVKSLGLPMWAKTKLQDIVHLSDDDPEWLNHLIENDEKSKKLLLSPIFHGKEISFNKLAELRARSL
jgi:glycosyltransferase involved in cell wall biosynthesis